MIPKYTTPKVPLLITDRTIMPQGYLFGLTLTPSQQVPECDNQWYKVNSVTKLLDGNNLFLRWSYNILGVCYNQHLRIGPSPPRPSKAIISTCICS